MVFRSLRMFASLHPSSGGAPYLEDSAKAIRFVRKGCANRPFFHIVVAEKKKEQYDPVIEQVGTYDPYPNHYNEKLVSLNLERIRYWMGTGVEVTKPVADLLGLCGFLPISPRTYMAAWRKRREAQNTQVTETDS